MTRGSSQIRPERVAEQIRVEIARILQYELKDPRIGLVTCTRVRVSGDLGVAKVYVSVLSNSEGQRGTMKVLGRASGYVRHLLSRRLGLRVSPEIRFVFDPGVEYGIELEKLIDEARERAPEETEDADEASGKDH